MGPTATSDATRPRARSRCHVTSRRRRARTQEEPRPRQAAPDARGTHRHTERRLAAWVAVAAPAAARPAWCGSRCWPRIAGVGGALTYESSPLFGLLLLGGAVPRRPRVARTAVTGSRPTRPHRRLLDRARMDLRPPSRRARPSSWSSWPMIGAGAATVDGSGGRASEHSPLRSRWRGQAPWAPSSSPCSTLPAPISEPRHCSARPATPRRASCRPSSPDSARCSRHAAGGHQRRRHLAGVRRPVLAGRRQRRPINHRPRAVHRGRPCCGYDGATRGASRSATSSKRDEQQPDEPTIESRSNRPQSKHQRPSAKAAAAAAKKPAPESADDCRRRRRRSRRPRRHPEPVGPARRDPDDRPRQAVRRFAGARTRSTCASVPASGSH